MEEKWVCPLCKVGVMRRSLEKEREMDEMARRIGWLVSHDSTHKRESSKSVPSNPVKLFVCDQCHHEEWKREPTAEELMWKTLAKYKCKKCGHVYDPEKGERGILMMYGEGSRKWENWERQVMPGTPFEKVPKSWVCPRCEATKDHFEKIK